MGYICTRCGGTNVVCEAIIDSYPGYVVKDPITLIEWVQGLKPGTIIKIRGIFIYHFL